jgi:hypothetical protein
MCISGIYGFARLHTNVNVETSARRQAHFLRALLIGKIEQ